jgi:hypothetical protein
MPVSEILTTVESVSCMGNWTDQDKIQIAILNFTDTAKSFHPRCSQLRDPNLTWQKLKKICEERFRGTHTDQFNSDGKADENCHYSTQSCF